MASAQRYSFHMSLVPGAEEEYERRHRELWPRMREALERSGYTNYTLFRHEQSVIGYCECVPDVATVLGAMAAEPVTAEWNASFDGVIAPLPGGGFATEYSELWHLA